MKVNKATRLATKNNRGAIKVTGIKGAKRSKKAVKAVKREAYTGLTGDCVLFVSGSKGDVFRRVTIDKNGFAKLTHNHLKDGAKYDGVTVDLLKLKDNDKNTRSNAGFYVAGKGTDSLKVRAISLSMARGQCKHALTIERQSGKEQKIKVTRKDAQYAGALLDNGTFSQWESRRLAHNKECYGAIVKG